MGAKEPSVEVCISESQSRVMICHGTENLDSHLSCVVTQGTINEAGLINLLTEYVLINLRFEGLDLMKPCGITGAW